MSHYPSALQARPITLPQSASHWSCWTPRSSRRRSNTIPHWSLPLHATVANRLVSPKRINNRSPGRGKSWPCSLAPTSEMSGTATELDRPMPTADAARMTVSRFARLWPPGTSTRLPNIAISCTLHLTRSSSAARCNDGPSCCCIMRRNSGRWTVRRHTHGSYPWSAAKAAIQPRKSA